MIDELALGIITGSLVLGLWAVGLVGRDRRPSDALVVALAVVELALLVQLVAGIVLLAQSGGDVSAATFVGYLLGVLVVLPAGLAWALGEPSRSGTAVLVVALLVVPFLELRLDQIWSAGA